MRAIAFLTLLLVSFTASADWEYVACQYDIKQGARDAHLKDSPGPNDMAWQTYVFTSNGLETIDLIFQKNGTVGEWYLSWYTTEDVEFDGADSITIWVTNRFGETLPVSTFRETLSVDGNASTVLVRIKEQMAFLIATSHKLVIEYYGTDGEYDFQTTDFNTYGLAEPTEAVPFAPFNHLINDMCNEETK